jgi:hypothetical protein
LEPIEGKGGKKGEKEKGTSPPERVEILSPTGGEKLGKFISNFPHNPKENSISDPHSNYYHRHQIIKVVVDKTESHPMEPEEGEEKPQPEGGEPPPEEEIKSPGKAQEGEQLPQNHPPLSTLLEKIPQLTPRHPRRSYRKKLKIDGKSKEKSSPQGN